MHTMQAPPVVARDGFIGAGVYMCVCVMLMPPFWLATLCWGSAVSKELAPCISATGVPVAEMRQEAGELSCTSSCWISVACSEAFCRVYVLYTQYVFSTCRCAHWLLMTTALGILHYKTGLRGIMLLSCRAAVTLWVRCGGGSLQWVMVQACPLLPVYQHMF